MVVVFILFFFSNIINVFIKVCRNVMDVIRLREYVVCFCNIVEVLNVNLNIWWEFFLVFFKIVGLIFFW